MTYGQKLSQAVIADLPEQGEITFNNPDKTFPKSGTYQEEATYKYRDIEVTVVIDVTVKKKDVYVSVGQMGTITFGTPLERDATASINSSQLIEGDTVDTSILEIGGTYYAGVHEDETYPLKKGTIVPGGTVYPVILNGDTVDERYRFYASSSGQILKVEPLTVEMEWTGKRVFEVGETFDAVATITNAVEGFPVEPLEYHSTTGSGFPLLQKSSYDESTDSWIIETVAVYDLTDNDSYQLKDYLSSIFMFVVRDGDDPELFPQQLSIERGQKLGSFNFEGYQYKNGYLEFSQDAQDERI